jgi:glycosyltransferase involved in cell wall biosynthesis
MQLSVVIPVYNEVESLPLLHQALHTALDSENVEIGRAAPNSHSQPSACWEAVYVDDGSSDGSLEGLEALAAADPGHTCVVSLRRNFGQTAAIAAGIDHARGEVIVLMDADLQNDPADIPQMLSLIEQGYDVVSGWRKNRQDDFITRKIPSSMANWLISRVTGVHLHDYGCTLKAYRREALTGFRLYGEMHRFIPAYAHSVGARIVELPVNHHPRRYGRTKYGLGRTLKVVLDLFTVKFLISYAHKPIYLFGGAGLALILSSMIMFIFLVVRKLVVGTDILGSPFFQLSTMFTILGFQSILMGLIAELLARTYHESQAKPTYTLRKVIRERAAELDPKGLGDL